MASSSPNERPALADFARVRLVVESISVQESDRRDESWAALEHLWAKRQLDSGGDRLTRDQLHERR